jgi:hypothetical protein
MRFADCFLLKQIDAAIPTALCEHLVSLIEAGQPEAANLSKDFRDNDRILRDDPAGLSERGLHRRRDALHGAVGGRPPAGHRGRRAVPAQGET